MGCPLVSEKIQHRFTKPHLFQIIIIIFFFFFFFFGGGGGGGSHGWGAVKRIG